MSSDDDDDDRPPPGGPVTPARIAERLARPDVRARLKAIVRNKAPAHLVEDTLTAVVVAILESTDLPEEESIDGWMNRIAANHSVDAVRATTRERARRDDTDVDALTGEDACAEPPETLEILPWLKARVAPGSTDAETVALLEDKAQRKQTYAQTAEAHGMTEAALKKRVARLVARHDKAWQKHKRDRQRLAWILAGAAAALVLAALATLVWRRAHRTESIGPDPATSAAPVQSATPVEDDKNIANPPSPSTTVDPDRKH